MTATPFLGMRGTGEWPEGVEPQSWREAILYLYPNGAAPLTAVMAMQSSEKTDSDTFHWFEQGMPSQGGAVTGVYTEPTLTTAYTNGGVVGTVLYLKCSQTVASEFRAGHTVVLEKTDLANDYAGSDPRYETNGEVLSVTLAGDVSYLTIQLHEDASSTYDLDEIDSVHVAGNANEQGGDMPDALTYDPEDYYNYTQIFRTSLSLTRTAMQTKIRYGSDAYKLAKRQALELHALELENAAIWGVRYAGRGAKNKRKTTSGGLMWRLRNDAPDNIVDYRYDPAFAGQTWAQGGEEWLNLNVTRSLNYGSNEKMALMGNGASIGINDLVRAGSEYNITAKDRAYGIRVNEWMVGNGSISMKTHPLFLNRPNYSNAMLIYEPQRYRWRYILDTTYITDPPNTQNRNNGKDAIDEEYKTEGGFEYHNIDTAMALFGIGQDNLLT